MQDLSTHKREEAEHRVILAITHIGKAVGHSEHGFYIGATKNTKRM
jgi:hypothetical protein